ncbi:hypothetical protein Bca4012_021231 [Brassica carinata]|uniref:Transmembrane protein n=1 Tax=Brassica carinata TaxID=52824 RepID=A0A8X7WGN0_BRACI|nr:hypothetical protein Bca52824_000351 [Brassica carinata]
MGDVTTGVAVFRRCVYTGCVLVTGIVDSRCVDDRVENRGEYPISFCGGVLSSAIFTFFFFFGFLIVRRRDESEPVKKAKMGRNFKVFFDE